MLLSGALSSGEESFNAPHVLTTNKTLLRIGGKGVVEQVARSRQPAGTTNLFLPCNFKGDLSDAPKSNKTFSVALPHAFPTPILIYIWYSCRMHLTD